MPGKFAGRVALVTGSSNGIGRATARLFAREGAKVTLSGRNASALEEARQELLSEGAAPNDVLVIAGDITKPETQRKLVDETVKKFSKLDILINNAGAASVDGGPATGFDTSLDIFDYTLNLNTKTALAVFQQAIPHLIASQGDVVNISSIVAKPFANPLYPYYSIAKAALDQMTISMAVAYIGKGVRVNGINPGIIATKFMEKCGATEEEANRRREALVADTVGVPIGRAGSSEEIAEAIAFLCDRQRCGFIVGHNMVIDGGSSLQMAHLARLGGSNDKLPSRQ